MLTVLPQIEQEIREANHILLIPHQHPDGDALGSCTAFMEYLGDLNKRHTAYCATAISPRLSYLAHSNRVTADDAIWQDPTIDLIIVFDSGDLRYAGVADKIAQQPTSARIINFDHHVTNERYGHLNFVLTQASSTAEVLYHFFTGIHIPININMATSLLTGVLTDTDNFTNAATSGNTLTIGHHLLLRGADIKTITASVFKDKTVNTLKLWGVILTRLQKHEELDLAYTYILQSDLIEYNVSESDLEGIANYTNNTPDARITLVLKELVDGKVKGSFRTTQADTDVAVIAKSLNGGGHKKAAGFTVSGPMSQAIAQIVGQMKTIGGYESPLQK